jgi:hypothetical protein
MANLDATIKRMKKLAKNFIHLTFPCSNGDDQDLVLLKSAEVLVDGYTIIIFYSISDYKDHLVKTFQIYPKNHSFLPFHIVCKMAKKFLGDKHVSLLEMFNNNKKLYCWSVVTNLDEEPIENPYSTNSEKREFEKFNFSIMYPEEVNFF